MCFQLFDFPYKCVFKVTVPESRPEVICRLLRASYLKSRIINSSPNKLTPFENVQLVLFLLECRQLKIYPIISA